LAAHSPDRVTVLRRLAETLAFAACGGCLFGLLGVPAGFLSGAMLVVACAALAGRPMYMPPRLTQAILILIGISLGAVVTPETLHGFTTYPVSIIVLIAAMAVIGFAGAAYLRLVHGWDRVSAYLGAAPGGLSQVIGVATELDGDVRGIAIVQTVRVVIVAVGLPTGLASFGLVGPTFRTLGGLVTLQTLPQLGILIVVSSIVAVIAHHVRFPGGLLFGAMLASAALHGSAMISAVMPWWAVNAAAVMLGAVTGSRFAGTTLRMMLDFILAALGSFAVSITIGAVAAVALVMSTPLRIADVMIAFAPGSVDAMMLLALALNIDPVYVGSHHLTRIFFVSFTTPLVARYAARRVPPAAQPKAKGPAPLDD
jgi:membrane AbrB-like protein